ncbi:hypothetical protein CDD83_8684 [Cordyceps sp. RAO-2017]|nr:hypothetical protein CDD83_8684 [Cordyceps sp. RAO-2017]
MSSSSPPLDLAIAVPTFIGSLLSFLATTAAISLHVLSPPKQHFRHALIINLLVADFINSLNNTISGAISLASGHKDGNEAADAACIANAWIGQISVQAVDFNILIISIIVLYTVRNSRIVAQSSTLATVGLCVAAWVPGFITSFTGLGLGVYGHVSGNWCWIRSEFLGLRYALTHAWRIAIFIATIGIYTYIYIHLKRMFGRFRVSDPSTGNTASRTGDRTFVDHGAEEASDTQRILVSSSFAVSHELDDRAALSANQSTQDIPLDSLPAGKTTFVTVSTAADDGHPESAKASSAAHVKIPPGPLPPHHRPGPGQPDANRPMSKLPAPPNLKKMLLMNGYPLAYIILWMPGIINRLTESVGSSPRWLRALQCSTQFIGFVNAFTYGFSEHMRRASRRWRKRRGFARAS